MRFSNLSWLVLWCTVACSDPAKQVDPQTWGVRAEPAVLSHCCNPNSPGMPPVGTYRVIDDSGSNREFTLSATDLGFARTTSAQNTDLAVTLFSVSATRCGDLVVMVEASSGGEFCLHALTVLDVCPAVTDDPASDIGAGGDTALDITRVNTGYTSMSEPWLQLETAYWPPSDMLYSWFFRATFYDAQAVELGNLVYQRHDGVRSTFYSGSLSKMNTTLVENGEWPLLVFSMTALPGLDSYRVESGVAPTMSDPVASDFIPDTGTAAFMNVTAEPPR